MKLRTGKVRQVQEILRLLDEELIAFLLPYSVQNELKDPSTPEPVLKASQYFGYSIEVKLTDGENKLYQRLLAEARGEAESKNIARDLFHVFEAQK
jgi:hypothetical protein